MGHNCVQIPHLNVTIAGIRTRGNSYVSAIKEVVASTTLLFSYPLKSTIFYPSILFARLFILVRMVGADESNELWRHPPPTHTRTASL